MRDVLNSIWGLLLTPDMEDPAYIKLKNDILTRARNMIIAEKYYSDIKSFKETVKGFISKHAMKSRKILGDEIKGKI